MRKTLPVPIIALLLLNVGLLKAQGEGPPADAAG